MLPRCPWPGLSLGDLSALLLGNDGGELRRLLEGLDVLVDTWLPDAGEFVAGGQLARLWLHGAIEAIFVATLLRAIDCIEAQVRSWLAVHPTIPHPLCDAVPGVLRDLIANVQAAHNHNPRTAPLGREYLFDQRLLAGSKMLRTLLGSSPRDPWGPRDLPT